MGVWRIVVYLLLPYALGNLIWRGIALSGVLASLARALRLRDAARGQRTLWVHAVSVGEVRSAAPLVSALVGAYPQHRVVVTTMTPTGSSRSATSSATA